jgi:hypothetical protein
MALAVTERGHSGLDPAAHRATSQRPLCQRDVRHLPDPSLLKVGEKAVYDMDPRGSANGSTSPEVTEKAQRRRFGGEYNQRDIEAHCHP